MHTDRSHLGNSLD